MSGSEGVWVVRDADDTLVGIGLSRGRRRTPMSQHELFGGITGGASYKHPTLPTIHPVQISELASTIQKKTTTHTTKASDPRR